MAKKGYGQTGIYNSSMPNFNEGESGAVAIDRKGRVITSPTTSGGTLAVDNGRKTVSNAGTAEALSATSVPCTSVIMTAELGNTGTIVVGGASVVATLATRQGVPLAAGDSLVLDVDDLNKVYLDATVGGEGVSYTVLI